jgi:hypothetical protein
LFRDITITHWPADVMPVEGRDGHAEIVDPSTGIIHSFYQLRHIDGRWRARMYAWTRLDGRGWTDPAHYYQGARAAAVSSMAGLIRKHEVADGDIAYRHALAMSITYNALSAKPAYVFPATSVDTTSATTNSGSIPEGALVMLPESFDTQRISNRALRKVAETLKIHGGYVVDRNRGAPFAIYVENGSDLTLHRGGWDNAVADDLERIRRALRQVVSARGWLDGNVASTKFLDQMRISLSISRYMTDSLSIMHGLDSPDPAPFRNHGEQLFDVEGRFDFSRSWTEMRSFIKKVMRPSLDLEREMAFRRVIANRSRMMVLSRFLAFSLWHGTYRSERRTVRSWVTRELCKRTPLKLTSSGLSA